MQKKPLDAFVKPFITAVFAVLILLVPTAAADNAQCLEAAKNKRFERLSTVCIDLPHRDRLKKMDLLMTGDYVHYLGTVEQPSLAFQLLKNHAGGGDIQAQYMYGLLYSTVHIATNFSWPKHPGNDGTLTIDEYNEKIRVESGAWAKKAADGGHSLAMLDVAEEMLRKSYTDDTTDLMEAIEIATEAKQTNKLLAEDLIARIRERIKKIRKS